MSKPPKKPGGSRRSSVTTPSPGLPRREGSAVRSVSKGKKKAPVPGSGARELSKKVKTAKGRKLSSTLWLQRQLNDPFVAAAKRAGYRSRAAFKLTEIDDKVNMLRKGRNVVDLGAAPGGWTQVAVERVGEGHVVGIDLLEMEPVVGAELLVGDFLDDDAPARLHEILPGPIHVVLSDMAASATGHRTTDHLRIIGLCEAALEFAREVLVDEGAFCAKVLQGGAEGELLDALRQSFTKVQHIKPEASRSDSSETYVVATGFRKAGV